MVKQYIYHKTLFKIIFTLNRKQLLRKCKGKELLSSVNHANLDSRKWQVGSDGFPEEAPTSVI
jgi:hypothetical protein